MVPKVLFFVLVGCTFVLAKPIDEKTEVVVVEQVQDNMQLLFKKMMEKFENMWGNFFNPSGPESLKNDFDEMAGIFEEMFNEFKPKQEFVEPAKPEKPVESVEPDQYVEPIDPHKPIESIEPEKPVESAEPDQYVESTDSQKPLGSIEPNKPVESIELNEPVELIEPDESVEPEEPDEPIWPDEILE